MKYFTTIELMAKGISQFDAWVKVEMMLGFADQIRAEVTLLDNMPAVGKKPDKYSFICRIGTEGRNITEARLKLVRLINITGESDDVQIVSEFTEPAHKERTYLPRLEYEYCT